MGLSGRFLNLIVHDGGSRKRSLRCIDLMRHFIFYPDTSPPMERIRLPSPSLSFDADSFRCIPVAERKVLCTDAWGRSFLFHAGTRQLVTMPSLPEFRWKPASLFVPSASGDDNDADPDGSLFLMERKPKQEARRLGPQSDQFQALVYRRSSMTSPTKSWHRQPLPPPPYLRDPWYWNTRTKIGSYAVLGGGSHICVSVDGAGTYCLDTASHTWSKVADWTLPFSGKVEYVPELKLWFGLSDSDKDKLFVAADLSTMDSRPELVGAWKDLHDTPDKWHQFVANSQLVYLGSRRFIIARFFHTVTRTVISDCYPHEEQISERFAVFTSVKVMPHVHDGGCSGSGGRVEPRVIKDRSIRTPNSTRVESVF